MIPRAFTNRQQRHMAHVSPHVPVVPDHYARLALTNDATALLSSLPSSLFFPFDPRTQDADLSPYDRGGMLDHSPQVPVLGPTRQALTLSQGPGPHQLALTLG